MNLGDLSPKLLIEHFACKESLLTPDPYYVWKTSLGFNIKNLFNNNRLLGFAPAAILALLDTYPNNRLRLFYQQQEYPIVRALAAQALLNLQRQQADGRYLNFARHKPLEQFEARLPQLSWGHDRCAKTQVSVFNFFYA